MTEKLHQKMKEEILKLPKEKQQAINGFDWIKTTEEIGAKFSLTETEVNDLQVETGLVLIGLTDIDGYTRGIENNAGLTTDEAKQITTEAMEKIFTPIATKMESLIKEALNLRVARWDQTVNFIVSGGDYSKFIGM